MDNNVQAKIQSMQKFVPFLHKLQEILKSGKGNDEKLVEIQILNNLLLNPEEMISIEELDHCETALLQLHGKHSSDLLESNPETSTELTNNTVDIVPSVPKDVLTDGEDKKVKTDAIMNDQMDERKEPLTDEKNDQTQTENGISTKIEIDVQKTCDDPMHAKQNDTVCVADSDEADTEEDVEMLIPQVESNEMILPDLAAESAVKIENNASEVKGKSPQLQHFDESTVEHEMIAVESANEPRNEAKTDGDDPLNVEEPMNKQMDSTKARSEDEDNDDVEIIECRNSPICIDSDESASTNAAAESNLQIQANNLQNPLEENIPKLPELDSSRKIKKSKVVNTKQVIKVRLVQNSSNEIIDLVESSDENETIILKRFKKSTVFKRRTIIKHKKPAATGINYITTNEASLKLTAQNPLNCANVSKNQVSHRSIANNVKPADRKTYLSKKELLAKPTLPKPPVNTPLATPQSNFLNAVNLQPTNMANPPSFSAQLLNKNILIPNAFYGNPPETRKPSLKDTKSPQLSNTVADRASLTVGSKVMLSKEQIYRRWLDNFLVNFASPLQIASNTCFVLLQRVLKYRSLQKIKEARMHLNYLAQHQQTKSSASSVDIQMILDLRNIFYQTDSQLSDAGIRFCEYASSYVSDKVVTLTTDVKTGQVTSRTRCADVIVEDTSTSNKQINGPSANGAAKRKQKPDVDEYTPSRPVVIESKAEGSGIGERKRSLRRSRTKRYDSSFSYNEDHSDEHNEHDSDTAIARKIEQKRLEAKQRRENMVKSFESAFIETFAKKNINANASNHIFSAKDSSGDLNNVFTSRALPTPSVNCGKNTLETGYFADNDETLDDGPKEHRIYKVAPSTLPQLHELPKNCEGNASNKIPPPSLPLEVIISSDDSEDMGDEDRGGVVTKIAPKNTDRTLHMNSKYYDLCVICRQTVNGIVNHYVNEHRVCEVYTSRLPDLVVNQLRSNSVSPAVVHVFKSGQNQYEATCVFCQKRCRFGLPYWYQHFTTHTGEYAYHCSGCGFRKPTRSLIQAHIKTQCLHSGSATQVFVFNANAKQVDARICGMCNYVQLHRKNVVQHLRIQHGVNEILPLHIQSVTLVKTPPENVDRKRNQNENNLDEVKLNLSSSYSNLNTNTYDSPDDDISKTQFVYEDSDEGDNLSYMISGMLDVQVHTE